MQHESLKHSGGLRLALAALVVVGGTVFVGPSFDFDTDNDGVADSSEVYEHGTDPAKPDASFNPTFVENTNNG